MSKERVRAKEVLAWFVHITPNEWAKFLGDDPTDNSLPTIMRALRLLVLAEEVGAGKMTRMSKRLNHTDACGTDDDCACMVLDLLESLATILAEKEASDA